ncbi:hypothetical protein D9M71_464010 [compost metagenome]
MGEAQLHVVARRRGFYVAQEQAFQVAPGNARISRDLAYVDRIFDIAVHQFQGELDGAGQGWIEVDRHDRNIDRLPHLVATQYLLDGIQQFLAGAVAHHFQHHAQRTVRAGAAHALAVEHMGMAGHIHPGEQLGHHRPAVGVEGAFVAIQQPGFGKEVGTVPEATEDRASRVGVAQPGSQQGLAVEADAEAAAHHDDVLLLLVQLGQGAIGGDGDAQVADHQVALSADDQHLEHRRRTHEIGRHQRIHRTGEGHHRKVLAQYEGHAAHRRRQSGTAGLVQMHQVLAFQDAFEGCSHRSTRNCSGGRLEQQRQQLLAAGAAR